MTIDDMEQFEQIIGILNETFGNPDRPVSDIKMRFYFKALSDLSIDQLNDASIILANTKTIHTFPIPAEIRQAVEGNPHDQAQLAFDKLIDAIRSIGPYRTVIFDDPAIHAFVQSYGGWEDICDKTVDEMKFMRNEFIKGYPGLNRRTDVPLQLTGIHDGNNNRGGWDHKIPPAIVGDRTRALAWTEPAALSRGKTPLSIGGGNA